MRLARVFLGAEHLSYLVESRVELPEAGFEARAIFLNPLLGGGLQDFQEFRSRRAVDGRSRAELKGRLRAVRIVARKVHF